MYTNILNLDRDAWMQQKLAMFGFRTLTSRTLANRAVFNVVCQVCFQLLRMIVGLAYQGKGHVLNCGNSFKHQIS